MNDSDDIRKFSHEFAEERLKKDFQDFLLAPEITGNQQGLGHGARVPAELIVNTGTVVEVSREEHQDNDHNNGTVLVHRNALNEIERIEIYCSCGKKTVITMDYQTAEEGVNENSEGITLRGKTDGTEGRTA